MNPKGKLLIIGGAEDKGDSESTPEAAIKNKDYTRYEILDQIGSFSDGKNVIEVITTASEDPQGMADMYKKVFRKIGYKQTGFINVKDHKDAHNEEYMNRINAAGAVLFSGGDQFRLSTIIGGTDVRKAIHDKYMNDPNFIVAGTSAGAMVMAEVMIKEGGTEEVLLDTDIKTTSGLGFLKNAIVDTHFIKRGRFGRLAHAVMINPGLLGIGLGEDAALIIKNGTDAEVCGSGMVVLIDGKHIGQTNITDAESGEPVYVEDLKVHLLVGGCRFSLKTCRPEDPIQPRQRKRKQ